MLFWSVSTATSAAFFEGNHNLVDLKHFQCLETLRGFLRCCRFEIQNSLTRWFVFLSIFLIFVLVSLENFAVIFDVRTFNRFKRKSVLLPKKYFHISGGTFLYLDWLMCSGQERLYGYFGAWSRISPSHSEPLLQNRIIWCKNGSNRANVSSAINTKRNFYFYTVHCFSFYVCLWSEKYYYSQIFRGKLFYLLKIID